MARGSGFSALGKNFIIVGNTQHRIFGLRFGYLIRATTSFFCALTPVPGVVKEGPRFHCLAPLQGGVCAMLISSAAKGRCGCENSTTLVAPVIGTMTPGDFIIIFVAIDLTRCSVNISGQINAFWRLTGSSSIAGLGMMAITAAIKEILVPREPFRMRRPGDGGLCTSRG
jgi:hypothetical protein